MYVNDSAACRGTNAWDINPMYYLTAIHKYGDTCKVG